MSSKDDTVIVLLIAGVAVLAFMSLQGSNTTPDYTDLSAPMVPANQLTTSQNGKDNIQRWEGYSRTAYQDIAGNWSIGIGHLIVPGDGLSSTSVLTDGQVYDLFAADLTNAEQGIYANVSVPISQGMFDALADFVFQFGAGKFASSTLLSLLNSGDYQGAANELPKWVHSGQTVVAQLVDRRATAQQMFTA
jgi:lysozyme